LQATCEVRNFGQWIADGIPYQWLTNFHWRVTDVTLASCEHEGSDCNLVARHLSQRCNVEMHRFCEQGDSGTTIPGLPGNSGTTLQLLSRIPGQLCNAWASWRSNAQLDHSVTACVVYRFFNCFAYLCLSCFTYLSGYPLPLFHL